MGQCQGKRKKTTQEKSTTNNERTAGATDVVVVEERVEVCEVITDLESYNINVECTDLANYCLPLIEVRFSGQTTAEGHADEASTSEVLNLGLYLRLLDKFLKQHPNVTDVTGKEEEFLHLLKLISLKRCCEGEIAGKCFERLAEQSERFIKIYHRRGVHSQELHHKPYWGSRQQLLSGKVIADWVEEDNESLDPIFGVLLQPTAGRVGPGDSSFVHNLLFDDKGYMAYHSAVHDAFGYLLTNHQTGPGYDYLNNSRFAKENPLAGQYSGIAFWRKVLNELDECKIVCKSI